MGTSSEPAGTERGFAAAVKQFPDAASAIGQLMKRSEVFCDICEELADAELALSNVPETPSAPYAARRLEWQELVDRLIHELAAALRESGAAATQNVKNAETKGQRT